MKSLFEQAQDSLKEQLQESNERVQGYAEHISFRIREDELEVEIIDPDSVSLIPAEHLEIVCEELHTLQDMLGWFKFQRAQHYGDR